MRAKDSCTGESIETSWSISRTRGWAADGGSEDRSWRSMESFVCQGGFREGAVPNQRVGMASTFMLQMIAPARGGQGGFGCPRDTVTALLCAPWAASTADASLGPESPFPSQTSTVIILMPIIGLILPSGLYVSCFLLRRALAGPDSSQRDTKFTFWRARVWDAIQIPISFSCEATSTYLWCL
jgi:hypothetical protein